LDPQQQEQTVYNPCPDPAHRGLVVALDSDHMVMQVVVSMSGSAVLMPKGCIR